MYWLNHVICWNSTTVHQYSEKGTCSIHTNQVNYYMMNFINFWLEMQVAIKHEENLSFYPVVLNCKYHWCNFQIFVYSNLQNSLAASGGVITFCTARLMVSPYVCRRNTGLSHANSAMFDPASAVRFIWLWPWPVADIDGWGGRCADIHLFRTIFSSPSTSNSLHHYRKLVAVSVLITFINFNGVRILYCSFQLSWFLLICN